MLWSVGHKVYLENEPLGDTQDPVPCSRKILAQIFILDFKPFFFSGVSVEKKVLGPHTESQTPMFLEPWNRLTQVQPRREPPELRSPIPTRRHSMNVTRRVP